MKIKKPKYNFNDKIKYTTKNDDLAVTLEDTIKGVQIVATKKEQTVRYFLNNGTTLINEKDVIRKIKNK
jgi:hypothetical protein